MNQSAFDELTSLVDALRAETVSDSITPERLGALLQRMIDILPLLDDSALAVDVQRAIDQAGLALNAARTAAQAATSAENSAANAVNRCAALAADIAGILNELISVRQSADNAASAAQQASSLVSRLSSRVTNLENFKTTAEDKLSKVPEYHSATWLDSEEGVFDREHPERRLLVRYTSMVDAINGGKKLIKKSNIVASGISVTTTGAIVLSFLEVDENWATQMGVYRVTRPGSADYCVVEKTAVPLPVYNANWVTRVGGGRQQLDELINIIESTPQVLMMINSQPVVWSARRSNDVVQLAVMNSSGMRIYTVEYNYTSGETLPSYEDYNFVVSQ